MFKVAFPYSFLGYIVKVPFKETFVKLPLCIAMLSYLWGVTDVKLPFNNYLLDVQDCLLKLFVETRFEATFKHLPFASTCQDHTC